MFKRIINLILIGMILLSFTFVLIFNTNEVIAKDNIDEKTYCKATLDDEFADNRIQIVLNERSSYDFEAYDKNVFEEYGCINIIDLTSAATSAIRYHKEYKYLNLDNFRRVLCLELDTHSKENVLSVCEELMKREDIIYAGVDYKMSICSTYSNDTYAYDQWALDEIDLPESWDFTKGTSEVLVGVVDSGIDGNHPDLAGNIENDLCCDFTSGTAVLTPNPSDPNGHGTHVAGIIGAVGNNGIGVTGINWKVKLVSLRVFNEFGTGSSLHIEAAINYAITNNILILNLSGSWLSEESSHDSPLNCVVSTYSGLLICAAGNDNINNDGNIHALPASINLPNIISVGSHNENSNMSNFSNYGATSADLFAPGEEILSTIPISYCQTHNIVFNDGTRLCEFPKENIANLYDLVNSGAYTWSQIINNFESYFHFSPADLKASEHFQDGYHYMDGTSMAAPFVTGVAALLLSIDSSLTATQIKNAILSSVDIPNVNGINLLQDLCLTDGKLNAYNAIKYVLENYSNTPITITSSGIIYSNTKTILGEDTYFNNKNAFYKINFSAPRTQDIIITSSYPFTVKLYDNDFNEITYTTTTISNGIKISRSFESNIHYLRIYYQNENQNGDISISIISPHLHNYNRWQYYNNGEHIEKCITCGTIGTNTRSHIVSGLSSGRYRRCLECHEMLDMNFDYAIVAHLSPPPSGNDDDPILDDAFPSYPILIIKPPNAISLAEETLKYFKSKGYTEEEWKKILNNPDFDLEAWIGFLEEWVRKYNKMGRVKIAE